VSRADGQVVGIIQGELDYDKAQDKAKLKEMNINEAQSSIFGTSASCITNEKKCLYNDVQEMENFNKEIADQKVAVLAEMEKTLKTFIGEHSKLAEWKIVDVPMQKINSFNKSDLVLAAKIALPQCLKNKNGVTSTNFETQIVVMNQVINPDLEYEFNTEVRTETIKLKVINQNNLEVRYNNPFQLKSEVVKLSGRCQ
jgi:hypothetical protein